MLNRQVKKLQTEKLAESFSRSRASFLVNCIGVNVEKMTELRKKLKQNEGDIKVIRNTLSLRAMEGNEILKESYESHLEGPNAFVLAFNDSAKIAKIIHEFSKDNEVFNIKAGILDGSLLKLEEIKTLASLPSKEVLQVSFLEVLSAPLSKLLSTVKEVPQGFVRVLSAKKDKG